MSHKPLLYVLAGFLAASNGRVLSWIDNYNDLIGILRMVAADREMPWTLA